MNIPRVADLLGLILFIVLFYYFYNIPSFRRSNLETILLVLTGCAAIIDAIFFISYLIIN